MNKMNIPLMGSLLVLSIIVCPILYFTFGPRLDDVQLDTLKVLGTIAACSAAFCFIVGEATGNNSQMDKLWSLLPIAYTWIIASRGGMSPRLVVMAVLATIWGIRLTFNFARKGAYSIRFWEGTEDYRWAIVRSGPAFSKRWAWALFDLGFISIYQNALVLMTTFPALVAMRSDRPFGWVDGIAACLMLGFIVWETVADEQQWAFQTKKWAMLNKGKTLDELPEPYNKGFNTIGLWGVCRHPNYFAEQGTWIAFYIFSIGAGTGVINWSIIGALLLVVLFQGSSTLAEEISGGKYPEYGQYCRSVPRFFPGKRYMSTAIVIAFISCMLTASCSSGSSGDAWVKVEGNRFIDPQGNEIIFRGLCFSDPVKLVRESQWNERYFAEAADWGANVVRFAVHPANINALGWEETFQAMDQGVEWAKQHGMYVIMDWHSIGNLKDELYTNPMYNTTKAETFKFWRTVAQRYKDEPAVALYELFNEPTITAPGVGTCTWPEWKALQEQIIDTVRTYNPYAVCLCAGFNWAYDLTPVAEAPVARPNVAYVSHPYPMKREQPWEEQWEQDFGYVADSYPVICTEIGYCLADEPGAHIPVMSTDVYGEHITSYFEEKGISFTVWCFDTSWAPTLISDWDFTPTTQGRFFKAYLQGKR